MTTAFIAFGSNLKNRKKNIALAIKSLNATPGISVIKASSLYETKPVGGPLRQPKYLNGALKLKTSLTADELLCKMKKIESKMGRPLPAVGRHGEKGYVKNGPRIIDLDLLLFGNSIIKKRGLIVPHPRMHKRPFVLMPLAEIGGRVMRTVKKIQDVKNIIREAKAEGKTIGLVPTMGYLHEGHLSLVRQAKKDTGFVVVSIFVNPKQFNNKNDLAKYPSNLRQDARLLENAGADLLFLPSEKEIYRAGHSTYVTVEGITKHLCGAFRPGHFRGVATVVAKLFNIITPDVAYFGLKDAQQAFMIRRMAKDLDMGIRIKLMPTVREPWGLALSSRNARLSPTEKRDASVIYHALQDARDMVKSGVKDRREIVSHIKKVIRTKKNLRIEYVDIVDTERLAPLKEIKREALIAVAAWAGRTRLIDNIVVRIKN